MPEIFFKGKEFVYNHHLSVPYRPIVPNPERSVGDARLDGNLIIHGDNLHALKALLPQYAEKVDAIYIDPPYNTGQENWCYNDNVNSPVIREWLNSNPVGIEDGLRHDKWLAMMWPRLRLLHELLAEHGVIFVSIDDNEYHRLRMVLDEIFGADNFLATIVARLNPKGRHLDNFFAKTHEYVLAYAKNEAAVQIQGIAKSDDMVAEYNEEDADGNKYRLLELRNRNAAFNPQTRPKLYFPIYVDPNSGGVSLTKEGPFTAEALPHDSNDNPTVWTWNTAKVAKDIALLVGRQTRDGKWRVFRKDFLISEDGEEAQTKPKTIWLDADLNMDLARKTVSDIFGRNVFDFPKPVALVKRLLDLVALDDAIVLDSFAGSGTTAQAVLAANQEDAGLRRFILVEMEDYADEVTAERVRRVIAGYAFNGKIKEELYREKLTFSKLKKTDDILNTIQFLETTEAKRFGSFKRQIKDGAVTLVGEMDAVERVDGLGGTFTFCALGAPLEMDALLTGESLPSCEQLGAVLFHMATNQSFDPQTMESEDCVTYLGETAATHVWLIYKPDLDFLKSPKAALTLTKAQNFAAQKPGKRHIVFAPARFVSQKTLNDTGVPVEFAPLPFSLFRIEPAPVLA